MVFSLVIGFGLLVIVLGGAVLFPEQFDALFIHKRPRMIIERALKRYRPMQAA